MAILINVITPAPVSTRHRTWRTEVQSELGATPTITFQRQETKQTEGEAELVTVNLPALSKTLAECQAEQITIGEGEDAKTLTIAEIALFVAAVADKWDVESSAS